MSGVGAPPPVPARRGGLRGRGGNTRGKFGSLIGRRTGFFQRGKRFSMSFGRKMAIEARTRQLQVATGGQYKYMLLAKMVEFLKTEFLEAREVRPTLEQLLVMIQESEITDALKQWLIDEGIPKHPRLRVVPTRLASQKIYRYAYDPPVNVANSQDELLKYLKYMHSNDEGGLLRSAVVDSLPLGNFYVENLAREGKIILVNRDDTDQAIFYKARDPELDQCVMDSLFVGLWRKIDVCNKEMSHINKFLRNVGCSVIDVTDILADEDEVMPETLEDEP